MSHERVKQSGLRVKGLGLNLQPSTLNPQPSTFSEGPKCECGVFGVYAPGQEVSRIAYFGLFQLQHRGQESAGIAVADGERVQVHRDMGLISQVFDEERIASMHGHVALGHTRYSTTGSSKLCNAQPIVGRCSEGEMAMGHNGNLVNAIGLRHGLAQRGVHFDTTVDSEVIVKLLATMPDKPLEIALPEVMQQIEGAYSVVAVTPQRLIGFRDPYGVRPLCIGRLNHRGWVLASETCALPVVGAEYVREVEPGEIVIFDEAGMTEIKTRVNSRQAMCVFEFIYLARPDSHLMGRSVYSVRRRMGNLLAQEYPAKADLVIGVPDSGIPAAIGYAEASKIPYGEGLIRNRYIHRTFIQPDQRMREMGVRLKFMPLPETLRGKRIVVVEDSIVRGTTTRNLIHVLREAGAKEIHMRVSSPPYAWPCFYGIDTPDREKLIASRLTVDEICEYIGADTLGYLSLDNVFKAVGISKKHFCSACFDGNYPIRIPKDMKLTKLALEEANAS